MLAAGTFAVAGGLDRRIRPEAGGLWAPLPRPLDYPSVAQLGTDVVNQLLQRQLGGLICIRHGALERIRVLPSSAAASFGVKRRCEVQGAAPAIVMGSFAPALSQTLFAMGWEGARVAGT